MVQELKPHPEWKMLFNKYKDCDYGTLIPHKEIESLVGLTHKKTPNRYYNCIGKWKIHMLRSVSRQIECRNNIGYVIVNPEEFRASANRQLKFSHRKVKKAGEIVMHVPVDLLSKEEKKRIEDTSVVVAQILHYSKVALKKADQIEKKVDKLLLDFGDSLDVAD